MIKVQDNYILQESIYKICAAIEIRLGQVCDLLETEQDADKVEFLFKKLNEIEKILKGFENGK